MDFFLTTAPTNVDLTGVLPGLGVVPLKGLPFPPDNPFFPLPPVVLQTVVRVDWVDMHGNVVGPDSVHKVGTVVTTVVAGFDTVVQRTTGASIIGVGTMADLSIQMVWLSLMSISPVITSGIPACSVAPGCDIYVGLDSGAQPLGKMRLTSGTSDGSSGSASIGRLGVTSDDPAAPGFLGLPVLYDVVFTPAGTTTQVARQNGLLSVFHGAQSDPSGRYSVVPEPSTLLLLPAGALVILGLRRKRRSKSLDV